MLSLHIAGTFQMLTLNSMDLQPSLDFLQFWCKVTLPSPSPQLLLPTPQKSSSPLNLLGFLKKIKFIYLVVPGICRIFCCALWTLVPWPRIKPMHWEHGVLANRPAGESPEFTVFVKSVSEWLKIETLELAFSLLFLLFNIPVTTKFFRFYPWADRADFLLLFSLPPVSFCSGPVCLPKEGTVPSLPFS